MNGSPLLSLCLFLLLGCGPVDDQSTESSARQAVTTFILVRHAEKAEGDNPDLTAEGTARAKRLRDRLADRAVSHVYSTDTKRTRQTATPTAELRGLEVNLYDPERLDQFARRLRDRHAGETVLVVGHSNTTPALANLLAGSEALSAFDESDYGNLLIITVPASGTPRMEQNRY